MPETLPFHQVLNGLLEERFRRNRAELAKRANISPSALSQYTRGKATPSLAILVHLAAALDVSLDYLVLGRPSTGSAPEIGLVTSQIDAGLRQAQAQAAALHDLVARTGTRLGENIRDTVVELMQEEAALGGVLSADEVMVVESCSTYTTIVTDDLTMDAPGVSSAQNGNDSRLLEEAAGAESLFSGVISDNIARGYRYDYVVPAGASLEEAAQRLRRRIIRSIDQPESFIDDHLKIYFSDSSCVPSFVLYQLLPDELRRRSAGLFDRVSPYFWHDDGKPGTAHAATVVPASNSYQYFGLLEVDRVRRLAIEVEQRRSWFGGTVGR